MKRRLALWVVLAVATMRADVPVLPTGQIITTITPVGPLDMGGTITVTCRMSDYSGASEIEGFNFVVSYDDNVLAFVTNSFNLGDVSGFNQQWLSKANQENAAEGYTLGGVTNESRPGRIFIAIGDLGIKKTERGTRASAGFLISFQLVAVASGASALTLAPAEGGSVLLDIHYQPTGPILLAPVSPILVRNPTVVFVRATDAVAAEPGEDTAAFTLTRIGPTNQPITVHFIWSGSAHFGPDFTAPLESVVIPAGAASATVTVTPVDDTVFESVETVTFTLQPSMTYDLCATASATIVIHDNDEMPPNLAVTASLTPAPPHASSDNFVATLPVPRPPPPLPAAKADTITNGMTLGQIVAALGPGWMPSEPPWEGIGIIKWWFSDGRGLEVWPETHRASDIVKTNLESRARFWFTRRPSRR